MRNTNEYTSHFVPTVKQKINYTNSTTKLLAIISLFFNLNLKLFSQTGIIGPASIFPDNQESYELIYTPPSTAFINSITWSSQTTTGISAVTLIPNPSFQNKIFVNVNSSLNPNACTFNLKATIELKNYNDGAVTILDQFVKSIRIEPYIVGSSKAFIGQVNVYSMQDNCDGQSGHDNCKWDFTSSIPNIISCAGGGNCFNATINNFSIIVPNPPTFNSFILNATSKCNFGANNWIAKPFTVNVKLNNPSISGVKSVDCSGNVTNNLVFTASAVTGANFFVWTLPNGWIGNSNSNQITVTTSGTAGGIISVQAFYAQGSPINSEIVSYNIDCCENFLTIGNIFPDATYGILNKEASNTITSFNIITNGAEVKLHALNLVHLIPGFKAVFGSKVHVYNEGCTGNFYRTNGNSNDTTKINLNDTILYQDFIKQSANSMSINYQEMNESLKVYPNPNNGNFKVKLPVKLGLPISISLINNEGKLLYINRNVTTFDLEIFMLQQINSGLYILKVDYEDSIQTSKLVIN
ncbi:MAG: T9SS type A sorting domain-containing protein [Bacteroidetes bacterium]|nr:T9SS type A sorting domain-containing protein [Bacteroidota bacterium]MCA6441912.1 T9SS type A sorting domain-containing protein [Bacteroidota bacterium]